MLRRKFKIKRRAIYVAQSGDRALEMVKNDIRLNGECNFKLIILESQLPIKDGYDTAKELIEAIPNR